MTIATVHETQAWFGGPIMAEPMTIERYAMIYGKRYELEVLEVEPRSLLCPYGQQPQEGIFGWLRFKDEEPKKITKRFDAWEIRTIGTKIGSRRVERTCIPCLLAKRTRADREYIFDVGKPSVMHDIE